MPQAIPAAIYWAATALGYSQTIAAVAALVAAAAVTTYEQQEARRKAREQYNDNLEDRKVMFKSAVAPRRITYGRDRVSGPLKLFETSGDKGQYLHLVVELGEAGQYGYDAIEFVYFNTEPVAPADPDRFVRGGFPYRARTGAGVQGGTSNASGVFTLPRAATKVTHITQAEGDGSQTELTGWTHVAGTATISGLPPSAPMTVDYQYDDGKALCRIGKHLGEPGQQADADLVADDIGWTTRHRGDHTCYLALRLEFDEDVFGQTNVPNVSADVRGRKVYDPRRNRMPSFNMEGSVPGGTLPTGWQATGFSGSGLTQQVVGKGIDKQTGFVWVDWRVAGVATATGSVSLLMPGTASLPAASNGQAWASRVTLQVSAGGFTFGSTSRVRLNSYDASTTAATFAFQAITTDTLTDIPAVFDCAGTIAQAGANRVGLGIRLDVNAGQTYECTIRVLAPMLWGGVIASTQDPIAWSENAVLCTADYLRDGIYGMGASALEVPDSEVIAGANISDEIVQISSNGVVTQKQYTVNGTYDCKQDRRQVLDNFERAMAGKITWVQGRWLISPGAYRQPSITIDESCIGAGKVTIAPRNTRSALFNAVRATYRSRQAGYVERSAPMITNAYYESQDGGQRLIRDLPLEFVNDGTRAMRLAKIELERERQAMRISLPCNLRAYDAMPSRTVALDLARYGWADKVCEVRARTQSSTGELSYELQETAPEVYDWNFGQPTDEDVSPNTNLPNPFVPPPALTGLAAVSGTAQLQKQSDGTLLTRALVSWTASSDVYVRAGGRIELHWRAAGATAWQPTPPVDGDATSAYIGPLTDGSIITIRARAVNQSGRGSDYTYLSHQVVGKTAAPSNVTGLTAAAITGAIRISWARPADADYRRTELRLGDDWLTGTPLFSGNATEYLWAWPARGDYTIRARHVDTSGNDSTSSAVLSITVGDSILIRGSGLDLEVGGGNMLLFSSFERDSDSNGRADGWNLSIGTPGDAGRVHTTSRPPGLAGGTGFAQKLDIAAATTAAESVLTSQGYIGIRPGANYSATAWCSSNRSGANGPYLEIRWLDATDALIGTATSARYAPANTVQRLRVTAVSPAGASRVRIALRGTNNTGASVTWDDVKFEAGDTPTAWSANPADALAKIWRQAADPGDGALDGDEWFDSDDKNKHYLREGGTWISVRDTDITAALVAASNAQDTADGKITSFYQTNPPSSGVASIGDLWFDTNDGNRQYRWSGSAWVISTDTRVGQALNDAATAQSTADGKVTTYFAATAPFATALGDLWFRTTDGRMLRWNGSSWVVQSTIGDGDVDTDLLDDIAVSEDLVLFDADGVTHTTYT